MKRHILLFVVSIFVFTMVISCQKEKMENSINAKAIRAQLVSNPDPSKEEVQLKVTGNNLKAATIEDDATLFLLFALDEKTFEVYNNQAIKYLVCYEIASNGYRRRLLTIKQIFPVTDGKVDLSQYSIDFEVGCPFSRDFYLKNSNNVNQITYFCRLNDGSQFAYFTNGNTYTIKLPPIANCKWQLTIVYDDGDLRQEYATQMIDYYNQSNELQLKIILKQANTVSLIEFDKSYLQGAYLIRLFGRDINGNNVYQDYPVLFDEDMNNTISYNAPFDIEHVAIFSMTGGTWYDTKIVGIRGDISIFNFK